MEPAAAARPQRRDSITGEDHVRPNTLASLRFSAPGPEATKCALPRLFLGGEGRTGSKIVMLCHVLNGVIKLMPKQTGN